MAGEFMSLSRLNMPPVTVGLVQQLSPEQLAASPRQLGGMQLVSAPDASFPAAFVPAAHGTHTLAWTCWFAPQIVAVQLKPVPE